jgi:DnaD/phage-associated family protein
MKLVLPGTDMVALDGRTIDQLLRAGSGDAALLFLYFLRSEGASSVSEASKVLRRSQGEIAAAMALLKAIGLLQYDDQEAGSAQAVPARPQKDETPEYSLEDIKRESQNGSVFPALVQEVQKSLGKILTSDDLLKLFGIYDSLGLPPELILHLVTYCIDENRRRYGPGRVPTLRYIEKVAFTWEREGITTLEEAERYIKELEARRGVVSEIKTVLQIRDRELTTDERRYLDGWLKLGFSTEVIERAYERTIIGANKFSWRYMDSILNSWQQKGVRTLKDIEEKDKKGAKPGNVRKPQGGQAQTPESELAEYERMKKYLKKMRGE